jgi:hypothetical protein
LGKIIGKTNKNNKFRKISSEVLLINIKIKRNTNIKIKGKYLLINRKIEGV